ncbi:hypothetical protein M9434_000496 [Picochlorum sp. BPE23]|nr:hypothetical protein M9434_000496 [Picochlorum sp. BPE23]
MDVAGSNLSLKAEENKHPAVDIHNFLENRLQKCLEKDIFALPLAYVRSENPLVSQMKTQDLQNRIQEHRHEVSSWETWESEKSRRESVTAHSVFAKLRPIESLSPRKVEPGLESPRLGKTKSTSKRPFTSRFRGVHRTVSTKRWEAQFRKNGKPTSLGCFDSEESAARAYDKMILWSELHGKAGAKPSVMNFDPEQYKQIAPWLQRISQDGLLQALRREGREEAARRTNDNKKEP